MKENPIRSLSGIPMLLVLVALVLAGGYLFAGNARAGNIGGIVAGIALVLVAGFCLLGLYSVQPNQSAVLSLFGKYVGTVRENGLRFGFVTGGRARVQQLGEKSGNLIGRHGFSLAPSRRGAKRFCA